MNFTYVTAEDWPPFAWIAVCRPASAEVRVVAGRGVETRPEWFAEAAWAGDFTAGDFDEVEVVTGSGGRIRNDGVRFVTSASTVDRLQWLDMGDEHLVSNSLPCLLNAANASLPASHPYYNREMSSIRLGLSRYSRGLKTSAGVVQLAYYHNLLWDGRSLVVSARKQPAQEPSSFEEYVEFLEDGLRRLARNAEARERRAGRFRLLATLSTGYDSPAVATLAARCGCREAISLGVANDGQRDSGERIAGALGIQAHVVSSTAWREVEGAEIPMLASGHPGAVIYAGAAGHLAGAVLLTGYNGDIVWDLDDHVPGSGTDLVRGDASGLGLTEYRLWAGFLHCPVPFWGARKVASIRAISRSPELRAYVLPGTDYNRPIPRRLIEEAGVARGLFGVEKRAAEPFLWQQPVFLGAAAARDYLDWLRRHRGEWWASWRVPPWRSLRGDRWINAAGAITAAGVRRGGQAAWRIAGAMPGLPRGTLDALRSVHPRLLNLRRYWFPWAAMKAAERYATVPSARIRAAARVSE